MSYYNKIKKYLNPVGEQESDFYINATEDALKEYFKELRRVFIKSLFLLNGKVSTGIFSYPIIGAKGGMVLSSKLFTPSALNIKTALWTTPAENGFPNLFDEIGLSITKSFTEVSADGSVMSPPVPIVLTTTHFKSFGTMFMSKIKTIGQDLTPDVFHQTLSEYIELAIKNIPPMSIPITGAWITGGVFTGTVSVNFKNAKF